MNKQQPYSIVTVVYEGDTAGLELQARSLSAHAPPELISDIIVIGNFAQPPAPDWWERTRPLYGPLADRAVLIPAAEIVGGLDGLTGWWSQQVLKVEVAKFISTDAYLILDSKHHLVKPLNRSFLEDGVGRLRIRCADYEGHSLRGYLVNALNEFCLPQTAADFFPTTTPPFPFDTQAALRLITYGQNKSGSLAQHMLTNKLTEFFLYSAFLMANDELASLYDLHTMPYPMIWPKKTSDAACMSVIRTARDGESPFFAVHRRAAGDLSPRIKQEVASLWIDAGLYDMLGEAMHTLDLLALPKPSVWRRLATRIKRQQAKGVAAPA